MGIKEDSLESLSCLGRHLDALKEVLTTIVRRVPKMHHAAKEVIHRRCQFIPLCRAYYVTHDVREVCELSKRMAHELR